MSNSKVHFIDFLYVQISMCVKYCLLCGKAKPFHLVSSQEILERNP